MADAESCDGCQTCIEACPYDAIRFNEELNIHKKPCDL
ncbi:MAG: 4Fe-4S binding protein [Desulfobacteraceae bacterium]|nr:MAG: 4Fe-4S binding protein [Desulfobacteraceae bacterium]